MTNLNKIAIAVAISSIISISYAETFKFTDQVYNINSATKYSRNTTEGVKEFDIIDYPYYGKRIELTEQSNNTINVNFTDNPSLPLYVLGGSGDNNTVNIISGKVSFVYGGGNDYYDYGADHTVNSANSNGNSVTISGGSINSGVLGGNSGEEARENSVTISSGSIAGYVGGGSASKTTKNTVIISGGSINGAVFGGDSENEATKNTVTISGGSINGYVFGGNSWEEARENSVTISSGSIAGNVRGGRALKTTKNTVTISGGSINGDVLGGNSLEEARENSVTISGGSIAGYVEGGVAPKTTKNTVIISGGSINGDVFGGNSWEEAKENSVKISAGSIAGLVVGGIADVSNVTGNSVTISGGVIQKNKPSSNNTNTYTLSKYSGNVYGGIAGIGNLTGNSVKISGGSVAGDVYGGAFYDVLSFVSVEKPVSVKATNNTVTYTGGEIKGSIYGAYGVSNEKVKVTDVLSGNTLNIGESEAKPVKMNSLKAENIANFENINFYLPSTAKNGDVALELSTTGTTDLSKSKISAYLKNATNIRNQNDKIALIKTAGILKAPKATNTDNVRVSIAGLVNVKANIGLDNTKKQLSLTFPIDKNAYAEKESKLLLESQLTGVARVNQGGDLVLDNLALSKGNGIYSFANMAGSDKRLKTGSHIDVKGVNLNFGAGFANGNLNSALFLEYGKGNWDSKLDNGIKGSGDSNYFGAGVYGKLTAQNGIYGEASLRGGRVKTESDKGYYDKYNLSNSYFGAHAGVGKKVGINNNELDFYAKYYYLHTGSDKFKLQGVDVNVNSINSNRMKVGVRDTINFNDNNALYVGAAYQYAFNAKAKAQMNVITLGESAGIVSPKLKGSTGIGELGYKYTGANGLEFSLGAKAYAGKERGLGADAKVKYTFK